MSQSIDYRDYRIVQMSAKEMAPFLGCSAEEAPHRLSINGMLFHHVYVVRDEFDDNPLPGAAQWFEAPITAKAAIDIHCYEEGFQRTFWPNYHDTYLAMRNCPSILRALQEVHRKSVDECENNIEIASDSFAFVVRERLGRCFRDIEFNQRGKQDGTTGPVHD